MNNKQSNQSFETGMLSYARSVQVTEGLFFATQSENAERRTPIVVHEKGVRGQSSEDKAMNPGKSNPQTVEYTVVPQGYDGVELSFSVRFMPLAMQPYACDKPLVWNTYARFAKAYRTAGGFNVLAKLFLWNIANARFAWRNRFQSDRMSVNISFENYELSFNPLHLSLKEPDSEKSMADALTQGTREDISSLQEKISDGLSNDNKEAFSINVCWKADMEHGQEIFPSQEYVHDSKKENLPSRVYAKLPVYVNRDKVYQASMHSQKISAALRHIDVWHDSDEYSAAIAVNPYGGVQETSAVLRDPKSKKDFYSLRGQAEEIINAVEQAENSNDLTGDIHFFMANLVRGGVFSSRKKA
ncbi:MAG: type I-F CRISPR-associated protein Csy3 [Aestuariivita sp.]|nr:type I-F CRISPR-associated protein Csy3 [Aestuariivita sp.]